MVLGNPVLDLVIKLLRLDEDLLRFRLRRNVGEGVVNRVSLSPTGVEIVGVLVRGFAQHQFRAFQRHPVMSDLAHDPIPRTGYSHIRSLECDVVGRRESSICRKASEASVCEVAGDQCPHVVQFFLGGLVSLRFLIRQQFRPRHSDLLSQTVSFLVKRRRGNGRPI
jgi:hypothetical protein